jgi:hypothetical protein
MLAKLTFFSYRGQSGFGHDCPWQSPTKQADLHLMQFDLGLRKSHATQQIWQGLWASAAKMIITITSATITTNLMFEFLIFSTKTQSLHLFKLKSEGTTV